MKRLVLKALALAVLGSSMSACTVSSGGGSGGVYYSDPYYHAWYDVYGNYCGTGYPTAGCNFYSDGVKIIASEDPYANSQTYYYDYWSYYDSFGYLRYYTGWAWLSSSGILYDGNGNALNNTEENQSSTDVIAAAATKAKQLQEKVGKALSQKYALNEDAGLMISKTLQDWAKIGKDRARTEADISDFSQRLFGLSADKAKGAFKEALASQSQKPIEELNVDVAAHWGTSPEVSKEILKSWYKEEVAAFGIK